MRQFSDYRGFAKSAQEKIHAAKIVLPEGFPVYICNPISPSTVNRQPSTVNRQPSTQPAWLKF